MPITVYASMGGKINLPTFSTYAESPRSQRREVERRIKIVGAFNFSNPPYLILHFIVIRNLFEGNLSLSCIHLVPPPSILAGVYDARHVCVWAFPPHSCHL